ncbi:hypothetical protein J3353_05325 [Faecalibacterium sp. Marseille-Q4137]|uniref:hypothetical protein n=1 Tax=Faecalibacterium sp. Marseille-Q4137 TaxID=2817021 RepID=UPI001A9B54AF|nr:hypothetical protein [Faecalibacterium sp. Marseille-Q4137]MBO1302432.1 hypothetical protein [Faecalibacterium sp. Marseille-Q4137]
MAVAISEGFKTCPEALLLRNIEKTQKRCKKVLTEGRGCGIILERQGPPERMTSESGRSKRTNMDTLKNEPQVRKDRKASEKSA